MLARKITVLAIAALLVTACAPATASADFGFITTWGSACAVPPCSGDNEMVMPTGIDVSPNGDVYVLDNGDSRVLRFTSSGQFVSKFGSPCASPPCTGDGEFGPAFGLALDSAGNVYVADTFDDRIQKFTPDGQFITKWGMTGSNDGEFSFPYGIEIDSQDAVYVADGNNARVQKFTKDGQFVTKWGQCPSFPCTADGDMAFPVGVGTDAQNNVYVTESVGNRVQKFTSDGQFLLKWGTPCAVSPCVGDGELDNPVNIVFDSAGNNYVSNNSSNRIQKFTPAGQFISQFGSTGTGNGEFNGAARSTIDCRDNLYITDLNNNRVQKFGDASLAPPPCLADVQSVPALSDVKMSPGHFRAATAAASRKRTVVGSRISFTLSTNATVKFTLQRRKPGRLVRGKCVKPKRGNRSRKRCARGYTPAGSFSIDGVAGKNSKPFNGVVGGKTLSSAVYKTSAVASNVSGSSKASVFYYKITRK